MKHSVRTLVKLAAVILIAGAGLYWFKFSPVPVKTQAVGREELVKTVFGTGTLEAKTRGAISPAACAASSAFIVYVPPIGTIAISHLTAFASCVASVSPAI